MNEDWKGEKFLKVKPAKNATGAADTRLFQKSKKVGYRKPFLKNKPSSITATLHREELEDE